MNRNALLAKAIRLFFIITLALGVVPARVAHATGPWYVAPGGSDSNSCLSTGLPCATINGAIGKASSGDTINVATGTYTSLVGSEVVSVTKSINLTGGWNGAFTTQGGMSTIDGSGARRGIAVNSGVTGIIERFVIQNGSADFGGGIYNQGTLTLNNSTVNGNTGVGGGIFNDGGTLTLNNSTVSGNTGGGIYNQGTLTLNNSTVNGNTGSGYVGGGIYNGNYGTLTLNNSTVSGNVNTGSGFSGGIDNYGTVTLNNSTVSGNTGVVGGIYNSDGTLTLNNSTVSGNTGGGIYNSYGTLTLNNSTVSGNTNVGGGGGISNYGTLTLNNSTVSGNTSSVSGIGGGVYNNGTLTLRNSILAGNAASRAGPDCAGTISSASYNLIGNTSGCTFTPGTGDLTNLDAKLWPSLIGSPGVHPLLPGSPAIDAGNPTGCNDNLGNPLLTDQRGVARVGRCDIGAYEFDSNNNPIKQVFLPLIRTTCKPGICGRVTLSSAPAAGVSLELRFFNGSSWSTLATTTTNSNGDYAFTGMPGLAPGQRYYVRYRNYAGTPGRLWIWGTRELMSYSAGSAVEIGNFDIADIALVSPGDGATVALPYTFQWTRRLATPSDTYEFDLYDPTDGNPYFYTVPPLGYVGTYTLNGLPAGFSPGVQYVWEIWVYSPDGGYGISYETRGEKFSNTGLSSAGTSQSTLLKQTRSVEDLPQR